MAGLREHTAPPGARLFTGRLRSTTVGLLLVVTLIAFEAMAVATALPTAVRALHGLAAYGWAFTAFLITNVIGMVLGGETADRRGARRPLLVGLVTFAAGLVVAGSAHSMAQFVAGRAVAGLGGGMVIVSVYVVIGDVYTEATRPRVFGALSAAWLLPALVGPLGAGVVAERFTWRLVFLGLPPFLVVGVGLLVPALRRSTVPSAATDRGGGAGRGARRRYALAAAAGVALLQWAGQRSVWIGLIALAAGLPLLALGLRRLLPPGTATLRRGVPAVVAFRGLLAGSLFAVESLVPLTLSTVHGLSPTAAGVPLTVSAAGWSAASWWQGRRLRMPRHRIVRRGFATVAVAALAMGAVAQPAVPGWLAYPVWALAGTGAGLVMPSLSVLLLAFTPPAERGVNAAALQISDAVGSAVCIGLGGVLVAASQRGVLSLSAAALIVDALMAAVAGTGAVFAGRAREAG